MSRDSGPIDDAAAAIQATHAEWVEAVARGDAEALGALLATDYEAWPAGAAPIVGREAAVQAVTRALGAVEVRQTFESAKLDVSGDWALDRGIESFVMTPRDGSPPRRHRQRAVILLHRGADGRWRYAWGMTSPLPV